MIAGAVFHTLVACVSFLEVIGTPPIGTKPLPMEARNVLSIVPLAVDWLLGENFCLAEH